LNAFGAGLPSFCRARGEPWARFAADLARLEWALVEVVHEPTSETLRAEDLASISAERWPAARLVASPSLRILTFDYPVNAFYRAYRDERVPRAPEPATSAVAVYRQGLTLWRTELDPQAALFLSDVVDGAPLGAAVAALEQRATAEASLELVRLLPEWLGAWVKLGFFRGVAHD
jgi:hypothetical protein